MAIQRFSNTGNVSVQPFATSGTYALANALEPGLYRVTTDTTQTFTTAQIYCATTNGFRFGAAIRGGQGYLSVPQSVASVTLTTGTFPLLLGFERLTSYALISSPTSVSFNYTSPLSPYTATITFAPPTGAASMGVYWPDGTFSGFALSASTAGASVTLPTTPTYGTVYPALVVAQDANGVWGFGTANAQAYNFAVFTSSGTYTPIAGSASAEVLIVGGGGGGANLGANFCGGGGGAGQVRTLTATPASASVAVTIGAGGSASINGLNGGATSFGGTSASGGGGGGGTNVANGAAGGSGGGGAGGTSGPAGTRAAGTGGAGTSPGGFAGGAGSNGITGPGYYGGGGGGGSATGTGANATSGSSGSPAPGNTHYTNIVVGRGGAGGAAVSGNFTPNSQGSGGSTYGGGGVGGGITSLGAPGNTTPNAAGAGNAGYVIVKALQ